MSALKWIASLCTLMRPTCGGRTASRAARSFAVSIRAGLRSAGAKSASNALTASSDASAGGSVAEGGFPP